MVQSILPNLPHNLRKKKNVSTHKQNVFITDERRIAGFASIEATTLAYGREPSSEAGDALIEICGRDTPGIGTDSATNSTLTRYRIIWKGLLDYCIMMEDYDSAILLHRTSCPKRPFPVCEDTAISYMKFRVLEKGSPVMHHTTRRPVILPDGTPLLAVGDWKSAVSVGLFRSALSKIHSHYSTTTGSYAEACLECRKISLPQVCKGEGCQNHPGSPLYWPSGCVTKSSKFKTAIDLLTDYAEKHYDARSTVAFLPGELRSIRSYLMSTNTVAALQLWCQIMIGIKLFLRIDEVLTLKMVSFKPNYFIVKGKEIVSLLMEVQGKRDPRPVDFCLWDDNICPDFSPVRPFLLYVATTGRKGGYLFPTQDQLHDETPTNHYAYHHMLSDMKYICKIVLKRDHIFEGGLDKDIAGTHILRKTGFFIAYWAKKLELLDLAQRKKELPVEDHASLLTDGRHKDGASTQTYVCDAATMYALYTRLGMTDPNQRVSPYQPIYVKTLSNFASISRQGNVRQAMNRMSLPDLATWYVYHVLEVSPDLNLCDSVNQLCTTAVTYQAPKIDKDEIFKVLHEHLPAGVYNWAKNILDQALYLSEVNGETTLPTEASVVPLPPSNLTLENTLVTSCDYQDLYNRTSDKVEKVGVLVLAVNEIRHLKSQQKTLRGGLRRWAHHAATIVQCVEKCHEGDASSFITGLGTSGFQLKKFKCVNGLKHTGEL
jgi:hypothetical protein